MTENDEIIHKPGAEPSSLDGTEDRFFWSDIDDEFDSISAYSFAATNEALRKVGEWMRGRTNKGEDGLTGVV